MWLKALAVLVVAGIAVVSVISLASGDSGSGSAAGSRGRALTVDPSSGSPGTAFTLSFTAPDSTGTSGKTDLGYDLALSGPSEQAACLTARSVAVPPATKGSPVTVTLDPAKLGGRWCAGTYTAKVTEIQRPVCTPGTMCPQYIRVVDTVGSATFRVS